jgi:hypothetical protein
MNIEFLAGETINQACARLVGLANETRANVYGDFNGIGLVAHEGADVGEIVKAYHEKSEARRLAWERSPEGIAATERRAKDIAKVQAEADAAIADLPNVDLSDLSAAITWLLRIREPSDRIGVRINAPMIVETFKRFGYAADDYCVRELSRNERRRMAREGTRRRVGSRRVPKILNEGVRREKGLRSRWLIGQAIAGLESHGTVHQVFDHFADQILKEA